MRALALAAVVACGGSSGIGKVRFVNQAPAPVVDDRQDVPVQPKVRPYHRWTLHSDSYYLRTKYGMQMLPDQRAQGVNAFDDVPDSTWFTNRIGKRTVTPGEIRRGPGPESPDLHLPWTIEKAKDGGTRPGFIVRDSAGVKFLLKFDPDNGYEMETGADVVTARLVWACGYNVPADHVVYFKRDDLQISPKAKHIKPEMIDAMIKGLPREAGGKIRGIASVLIDGKPIGGTSRMGVREDDPNDRIPHELRRDLRGRAAMAAWLNDDDLREDNSLDTWVADPANPAVHYVMHYALDFGNSLGADGAFSNEAYMGYEYGIDFKVMALQLITLGIRERGWEGIKPSGIRGVGLLDSAHYDPGKWKTNSPAPFAIVWADRFDKYWGSKILLKFTREQIAAAVDAARFSDARAKPFMVDMLVARQRKTAWYWFRKVNPIDEFAVEDGRVCFTDLALANKLETDATRFTITPYDRHGKLVGPKVTAEPDARGRACFAPPLSGEADGYTILRVDTSRGMPGTQLHLARDPVTRAARVVGVHRL